MNSKKALIELYAISNCTKCEHYSECNDGHGTICDINKNIILKDLERLEQLEKDGQVLMNQAFKLSTKLTKYKKALDILKENLCIEFKHNDYFMVKFKEDKEQECDYTIMFLDNKEEYELLKEVLEGEN